MKNKKTQKGITLIALIITIIVLLILAVVAIGAIQDGGLLQKTEDAVMKQKLAEVREEVELALADAYIVCKTNKATDLGSYLTTKYGAENVNAETGGYTVEYKGYTFTISEGFKITGVTGEGETPVTPPVGGGEGGGTQIPVTGAWVHTADGKKITNGTIEYKVGLLVGATNDSSTEGKALVVTGSLPTLETGNSWAILGASDDGKILLTTTKNITKNNSVKKVSLSGDSLTHKNETVKNALNEDVQVSVLDMSDVTEAFKEAIADCGITVTGTVAESVRSIDVDDINRVTTYDPEHTGLSHNSGPYNSGYISEYGKIESDTGRKIGESYGTNSQITVKNDFYNYFPETLTSNNGTKPTTDKEWYDLLFANTSSSDTYYWLASPFAYRDTGYVNWGLRLAYGTNINGSSVWRSYHGGKEESYGVRPVITLQSEVEIGEPTPATENN